MRVLVVGGGFVGMHEAVLFAKYGNEVLVIDVNREIASLIDKAARSGDAFLLHVKEKWIIENWEAASQNISATSDYGEANGFDPNLIAVAVNTPIRVVGDVLVRLLEQGERDVEAFIDLGPLRSAVERLTKIVQPGVAVNSLVTIFPGGTRRLVAEKLAKRSGLRLDEELFVTHTPERLSPGAWYTPEDMPRLIGGVGPRSVEIVEAIYRPVGVDWTRTGLEEAELAKLYENAWRLKNIAMAQELLASAGPRSFEVVSKAFTRPFDAPETTRVVPGPYAGGTCLVKDSVMYWCATGSELIRRALIVNETTPKIYAARIVDRARAIGARRILFLGLGYKPGSPYYISPLLNPVERVIREIRSLAPELEVRRFDEKIPEASDFSTLDDALNWAEAVVLWMPGRLMDIVNVDEARHVLKQV